MIILITGGHGFLGKHLVPLFKGHTVVTPRSIDFDLREQDQVRSLLKHTKPDVVIHLAANCGGIGYNQKAPGALFYDNAIMGVSLMHEAYKAGTKKFVMIGTVCAYPKHTETPFSENDLWRGYPEETNAPYGLAKKMLLVQAQAYREQYGFNAIYLLPVNLYGPGDNFGDNSHVIPALIKKFVQAKERKESFVEIWGTGTPTREFLYVKDAARAIYLATMKYDGKEPVNIGTGQEISIRDLALLIQEEIGYEGGLRFDTTKPDGQPQRMLDTTRAKDYFGFSAATSFKEGLHDTIASYALLHSQ